MSAQDWAAQIWKATWQGGIFILLVWLACRYWKSLSAEARGWLWWLACAKLILGLVPLTPIELPLLRADEPAARPITTMLESVDPPTLAASTSVPTPITTQAQSFDPWIVLAALWGLGVLVKVIFSLIGAIRLRGIVRRATSLSDSPVGDMARTLGVELGISRSPRVVASSEVTSPLVVGMLHPTVVVSSAFGNDLTQDELRLALLHELAHIRRRDLLRGIVPMVAEMLFFFLPPAWFAYREWVTEREAACDEAVLRHSGVPVATYAGLLLRLVTRDSRAMPAAVGATAGYHTLKRRLLLMKTFGNSGRAFRWGTVAVALAAVVAVPWTVTAQTATNPNNLLRNSSLEKNSDGWVQGSEIEGVRYMRPDAVSKSGKGSLAIIKTASKYFPVAQWSQPFRHSGKAKFLKIKAWVKAQAMTKAVIDVQFLGDGGAGSKQTLDHKWAVYVGAQEAGDPPATHDWKEVSGVVPIAEGTQDVVVALQVYGPGSVWFDDITAEYSDESGPSASETPAWTGGPNVAKNGDFERGLAEWSPGSLPEGADVQDIAITPDSSVKHGGKQSMLFARSTSKFFPVKLISQGWAIEKGKYSKARLSVWIKAENASKLTIPFMTDNASGEGTKDWAVYVGMREDGDSKANHDWRQYVQVVSIPPTATEMSFAIEMYGPGRVWVDDFEVSLK